MNRRPVIAALLCTILLGAIACAMQGVVMGLAILSTAVSLSCIALLYHTTHVSAHEQKPKHDVADKTPAISVDQPSSEPSVPSVIEPSEPDESDPSPAPEDTQDEPPTTAADEAPDEHTDGGDTQLAAAQDGEPEDSFDYDEFRRSLITAVDPLAILRDLESDVRARRATGMRVSAPEAFLARQLQEMRLDEPDAKDPLPRFSVARLHRSGLFYLKVFSSRVSYIHMLRVVSLESALNALHFANEYYHGLNNLVEEDIYKVWQRTCSSVCNQAPVVDTANWSYLAMPWQAPYGPTAQGEWSVRHALSEAIETVQLPYRLDAKFRCNVAAGDIALEFLVTPARAFPRSSYAPGIGIVPATLEMRRRAASDYAARVGLLLTSHAFRTSQKIARVWISAIMKTPTSHACAYSACIGRKAFSQLDLGSLHEPLQTLRKLGTSLITHNEMLTPTESRFYLEDEEFCPKKRHDLWSMSERVLPLFATQALGATRVSDLVIHEQLPRVMAADFALRSFAPPSVPSATQTNVQAIMHAAHNTSDMSAWAAAERVADKLIAGQLDTEDAEVLRDEFVDGDDLTKALDKAQSKLTHNDPLGALDLVERALGPLEGEYHYHDTDVISYRSFESFSERVLYNRLRKRDTQSLVLVPDSYVAAHLMVAAILSSLPQETGGDATEALVHARCALHVAPFSESANLGMASCLEANDDLEGAIAQIKSYLGVAFSPHAMGLAYFMLASLEQKQGHSIAAKACYQRCIQVFPPLIPFVMSEVQSFAENGKQGDDHAIEPLSEDALEDALEEEHIPYAPTSQTVGIIYEGAIASVDAEVFPVAHELIHVLEVLTGDDVIHGIRMSLEHEPDA